MGQQQHDGNADNVAVVDDGDGTALLDDDGGVDGIARPDDVAADNASVHVGAVVLLLPLPLPRPAPELELELVLVLVLVPVPQWPHYSVHMVVVLQRGMCPCPVVRAEWYQVWHWVAR